MTQLKEPLQKNKTTEPFERVLVRQRRGRAQKILGERFLYMRCVDDVVERVLDVRKNFDRTLLIGALNATQLVAGRLGAKLGHVTFADNTAYISGLDIVCDEEALPFKPGSFDLVVNLLTLHGVNQVPQALAKIRTVLKPDGLFLAALFGGETLGTLRHTLYAVEDQLYGRVSPRVASMIRLDQAASLLSASGYTMPVADRDVVDVNYSSLDKLYKDLRLMGETNMLSARAPNPVSSRFFQMVEALYTCDHSTKSGKLKVRFEIIWLTGWAPHPNQPKPLKPGSATTKLAVALGVQEEKL
ncbi:MAG: methyltransferase domain-containing protein [Robiginitomaculum sp.]|nr:methyltransferase domain-containing protein [Robiginitomaculum sp.]